MELGKASAYALFATVYIAERNAGKPVQGRDIARDQGIPFGYLLKILQQLVKSDILRSQVGRAGGFTLRRGPESTTVLEVLEAVEGPFRAGLALTERECCSKKLAKVMTSACHNIACAARDEFRQITIHQLMQ